MTMPPWTRISKDFTADVTREDHEIVVIGSGYGGGVAAARLSRAGRQVTLLERGREIGPGSYPRTMKDATDELQVTVSNTGETYGKTNGLYDVRLGDDMAVFVGCGLGGTSLINANVAVAPDPAIYADWPDVYKNDPDALTDYFALARKTLGSRPHPKGHSLPKVKALKQVAKGIKGDFSLADINVTFKDGVNAANITQSACNNCGDCVTGCNYRAKNTVLMNYLPDAVGFGARIYTGAAATHLSRADDLWHVHIEGYDEPLKAQIVILAAGTLGSTEILLRSGDLRFSDQLGKRFSGNGDVWAFGYNANMPQPGSAKRAPVHGVGAGPHHPSEGPAFAPGPCITGMIRVTGETLENNLMIEEGVMPGALAAGYATAFPMLEALMGDPLRFGDTAQRLQDIAGLKTTITDDPGRIADSVYDGPLSRTMPFLVMSHDASAGNLVLRCDKVTVDWKNAGLDPAIVNDAAVIRQACDAIQAEYLPTPLWQDALGNRLVTVHPIGGCAMGNDHISGATNADTQVFRADGKLHPDLFVCDGAVLPRGVGVNPHLTITAVAERAMAQLAKAKGWTISDAPTPKTPIKLAPQPESIPEIDWPATLAAVSNTLRQIDGHFDRGPLRCARWKTLRLWQKFVVKNYDLRVQPALSHDMPIATRETIKHIINDDADLRAIVAPIVKQARAIVEPINTALIAGDYASILKILEAEMGDISPPVFFHEEMTGHISAIGLHDKPPPSDPYAVAAKGGQPCTLAGDIHAATTRQAVVPPGNVAQISAGFIESPAIGGKREIVDGKFYYLTADDTQVEHWQMRYEGKLAPRDDTEKELTFKAFKTSKRRAASHWWTDQTELRIDICDDAGPVACGILTLALEDIVKQSQSLTFSFDYDALRDDFADMYATLADTAPKDLPRAFADPALRLKLIKGFMFALSQPAQFAQKPDGYKGPVKAVETLAKAATFGRMAHLTLRNYGGFLAYIADIQGTPPLLDTVPKTPLLTPEFHYPVTDDGATLQLTRYKGGTRGPVMLAGGFGTRASSFALPTVDTNLVDMLVAAHYDVWLFDYRGSGEIAASQSTFTLDDVAQRDWPAAISKVLAVTKAQSVQALVHCVGSLSLFMALLHGEDRVRSVIASQLGAHPITNYYKFAQSDAELAGYIHDGLPKKLHGLLEMYVPEGPVRDAFANGIKVIDPRSPRPLDTNSALDMAFNALAWNAPDFAPTRCNSPTCHRITFIFGPSYQHENLNQETHLNIDKLFGPVSSYPFKHIGRMFGKGRLIGADGADIYMGNPQNLRMPIHFIAGANNPEMLPEATLRTQRWLQQENQADAHLYTRHVYPGYGHMDCFIGKNAAAKIFGHLLEELDRTK